MGMVGKVGLLNAITSRNHTESKHNKSQLYKLLNVKQFLCGFASNMYQIVNLTDIFLTISCL